MTLLRDFFGFHAIFWKAVLWKALDFLIQIPILDLCFLSQRVIVDKILPNKGRGFRKLRNNDIFHLLQFAY